MLRRIIIAGGGTGGHIFPAIAIANALKKIDVNTEILFVGANGKMEMEKVPKAGYEIKGIDIAGFNRSSLIKNIGLPIKLVRSFFQVMGIFRNFRPDAVVGVGGYSSFPVLRYAQAKGIPSFIHESNSFAGKSNIMLGKRASRIFVASDGMEKFFPATRVMLTGNPVRKSIAEINISRIDALKFFGLQESKQTVFIVGGSLGAKSINEAAAANVEKFEENNLQVIWQTGTSFAETAAAISAGRNNIWTEAFITEMENAYAAADFVVSRSGAMAVTELSVVGKPVVFVPYPFAAEDHQTANAQALVNKSAALMVKDSEVSQKLFDTLMSIVNQPVLAAELKENIYKLRTVQADMVIAKEILQEIKDVQ